MTMKPFFAGPEHYETNKTRNANLRVVPAVIRAPGKTMPGVAIFSGKLLMNILDAEEAFDFTNRIADILEEQSC